MRRRTLMSLLVLAVVLVGLTLWRKQTGQQELASSPMPAPPQSSPEQQTVALQSAAPMVHGVHRALHQLAVVVADVQAARLLPGADGARGLHQLALLVPLQQAQAQETHRPERGSGAGASWAAPSSCPTRPGQRYPRSGESVF